MPFIVLNGFEEEWIKQAKDLEELNGLFHILMGWSSKDWKVEELNKKNSMQMNLF